MLHLGQVHPLRVYDRQAKLGSMPLMNDIFSRFSPMPLHLGPSTLEEPNDGQQFPMPVIPTRIKTMDRLMTPNSKVTPAVQWKVIALPGLSMRLTVLLGL
jgi:hypothetical protein